MQKVTKEEREQFDIERAEHELHVQGEIARLTGHVIDTRAIRAILAGLRAPGYRHED